MEKYLDYLGYSEFGGGGSRILDLGENHPGVNSLKFSNSIRLVIVIWLQRGRIIILLSGWYRGKQLSSLRGWGVFCF